MSDDTTWLDATGQAELVRTKEASPAELVAEAITRIEKLNPQLNAVIHELFDRAQKEAAGDLPAGPFRGVPFLLKDLGAELAGTAFNEGLDFSGDYVSTVTQELTQRYIDAGFVICGKTNTPELGILPTAEPRRFGPSRNPWNTDYSTGGSSGGSAAAVASGMVPAAHANDGGGSIRIPASCCGLVGLKPTRGRNSLAPNYGDLLGGLVCEHVVTRSVRDSAAILDVTSGPVPGDPYWAPPRRGPSFAAAVASAPPRLRVAVMTAAPTGGRVDRACVAAVGEAANLCESLGHRVEGATLDVDGTAFTTHFINQWACGNAWAIADWESRLGRAVAERDVEPLSWALIELGRSINGPQYLRSIQELQKISRQIAEYFEHIDVLLTPTLGEPPAPLGTFDSPPGEPLAGLFRAADYVPFTPPFNVTGQPAISLPLHWDDADLPSALPIGVQFVGRFGDEETLLSLAGQLEQAAPWAGRRPPVSA
ncbi:MAG TPA: amidase family protein [Acidimicrobiales bacterium]|jgi:amidase|nr:amidase family protein [Acidimicrobiales bacterium]